MRVLVTGAAGFVGSTLAQTLLARGDDVVGVDCLTDYYDPAFKTRNLASLDAMEFHGEDLNEVDLPALLDGVEVIFHQAGQPGVRASWGAGFQPYTRRNVDATQRLLEAARSVPTLTRFVYASSSSVYGNAERYPTDEAMLPQPISPYGVTKLAAEHLCTLYGTEFDVPTLSLRYFTVYGPRQRPDMAFTRFLRAAVKGEAITLYGTGDQVREFTFVDDIVAANLAAVDAEVPPGEVINVSGGSSISVNEVLDVVNRIHGDLDIVRQAAAPGDVMRTGGDTARARDLLGWAPVVGIEEGLRHQYDWVRSTMDDELQTG